MIKLVELSFEKNVDVVCVLHLKWIKEPVLLRDAHCTHTDEWIKRLELPLTSVGDVDIVCGCFWTDISMHLYRIKVYVIHTHTHAHISYWLSLTFYLCLIFSCKCLSFCANVYVCKRVYNSFSVYAQWTYVLWRSQKNGCCCCLLLL